MNLNPFKKARGRPAKNQEPTFEKSFDELPPIETITNSNPQIEEVKEPAVKQEQPIVLNPIDNIILLRNIRKHFIWSVVCGALSFFSILCTALLSTQFIYSTLILMLLTVLFLIQHTTYVLRKEIRDNAKN